MTGNFNQLDKAHQKSDLTMAFGRLMSPLDELAELQTPPSIEDYHLALAKVSGGEVRWLQMVKAFTTFGDVKYKDIYEIVYRLPFYSPVINSFRAALKNASNSSDLLSLHEQFRSMVGAMKVEFIRSIDKVRVDWQSKFDGANTPFTVYNRIQDAVVNARQRVHYFDRHLADDFFQLHLRNLDRSLSIRLVTTKTGVNEVMAVSDRARQDSIFALFTIHAWLAESPTHI